MFFILTNLILVNQKKLMWLVEGTNIVHCWKITKQKKEIKYDCDVVVGMNCGLSLFTSFRYPLQGHAPQVPT